MLLNKTYHKSKKFGKSIVKGMSMILWNPFNSESLSERNTDEKEIKDIAHYFNKAGEYLKTAMLDYYNKLDDDLREKISKNIKETAY